MEQEERFVSLTSLHFSFNTRLIIHRHRPGSRIPPSQHHALSTRQQSHSAFCSLWFSESHGPCKQLTVAQTRNYSRSRCLTPAKKPPCYGRAAEEDLIPPSPSIKTRWKRERTSPPSRQALTGKLSLWSHCGKAAHRLLLLTSERVLGSGQWLDRGICPQTLLRLGDGCDSRHIPAKVQCSLLARSRQLVIQGEGFPTHPDESPLSGVWSSVRLMVSHLLRRWMTSSDTAFINNVTVTDELFWSSKRPFTFALLS